MQSTAIRNRMGALALLTGALFSQLAFAQDCGCGAPRACQTCQPVCRHCFHYRKCCCGCESKEAAPPKSARYETAPKAAIVESLPMFNATPGIYAMPMMMPMAMQQASFQMKEAVAPKAEQSCSTSRDRMVEIEDRVDALDLRMRTIQRAVEIQTRILEEMKEEGKFPSRYPPSDRSS